MGSIVTIGDVQDSIMQSFQAELQTFIDEIYHTRVDEAWFLVHMKWWPHGVFRNGVILKVKTLLTKIVACPTQPPKVLASACFHVNYRQGKLTRLWMLPPEDPLKMAVAGHMGWLNTDPMRRNEGPMRETETIEDAMSIKPALIHRPH